MADVFNTGREIIRFTSSEDIKREPNVLLSMIADFKLNKLPRLTNLKRYLENDNPTIIDEPRRNEEDVADVRAPHAFASYIVTFMQGYMTGNPIGLVYEDDEEIQTKIDEVNKINSADHVNGLLERDAATYGWAFEIHYRTEDGKDRFKRCDPMNTFVIYDMTIDRKEIGAVRFYSNPYTEEDFVEFYDESSITTYIVVDDELQEHDFKAHAHGDVPINELENNDERMGDFERVIPQMDLYDSSQSDTANYMQDFNDAILGLFGDMDLGADSVEDKIDVLSKMRKARLLHLIPSVGSDGKQGNIDAKYLTKNYDVAGTEAYKKRIVNDIHKLSFTPDLTDEKFAGAQSGKALEHKLFGLEVIEANKENALKAFLQRRYSLIMTVGEIVKENNEFDPNKLEINIVNKVPNSLSDAIENFNLLSGDMTNETKLRITKVVNNPEAEQKRLDEFYEDELGGLDIHNHGGGNDGAVDGLEE